MSQQNDNILCIPVQINGDGSTAPTGLLDRELYVLDNGTLYVGKKQSDGSIKIMEIAGRVVDNATIKNPKITQYLNVGTSTDDKIVISKETFDKNKDNADFKVKGRIYLVDEGKGYN